MKWWFSQNPQTGFSKTGKPMQMFLIIKNPDYLLPLHREECLVPTLMNWSIPVQAEQKAEVFSAAAGNRNRKILITGSAQVFVKRIRVNRPGPGFFMVWYRLDYMFTKYSDEITFQYIFEAYYQFQRSLRSRSKISASFTTLPMMEKEKFPFP